MHLLDMPVFANLPALNIESLNIYSTATNRNFKINLGEKNLFFRIGRNNPDEVGINRESEIQFYIIAENLRIAPKLLGYEINNRLFSFLGNVIGGIQNSCCDSILTPILLKEVAKLYGQADNSISRADDSF